MYLDEDNFLIVSDIITKGRKTFFISKKRSIKLGLKDKYNTVREDGYKFRFYYARLLRECDKYKIYENWISPDNQKKMVIWKKHNRQSDKIRVKRNKVFIKKVKSRYPCQICGYNKCNDAKHFHHIKRGGKRKVSGMKEYSIESIKEEIRKCIILCANCHAEIHEKERNIYE